MTKKSAIVLALGMMAVILSAAVAMSLNFGIGSQAEGASLVKPSAVAKQHHKQKPIVKTRHVTIHREKKAPSTGPVTVVRALPSSGSSSSTRSTSTGGYHDDDGGGEIEHEHEGGGGEGGDD